MLRREGGDERIDHSGYELGRLKLRSKLVRCWASVMANIEELRRRSKNMLDLESCRVLWKRVTVDGSIHEL